MKFFLTEISEGDAKIAGPAVYSYDTENAAVAAFHQKLSTAMKSDLYTSELVVVFNENGTLIKREKYMKEVEPAFDTTETTSSGSVVTPESIF